MPTSEFTYVIPPYLLDTCIGQSLHKELCWIDNELGANNCFSTTTSSYRFRLPRDLSQDPHSFCDDKHIDELIRAKLRDKFSALGILGQSPPGKITDEYLFELYEIFKDRLLPSSDQRRAFTTDETDTGPRTVNVSLVTGATPIAANLSVEPHSRAKESVFDIPKYGEFIYKAGPKHMNSLPLETCPLDTLISWAQNRKEHKYSFFPYLMSANKSIFLTSLPMYWTPLSAENYLRSLDESYGLQSDIEDGYSVLRLKLSRENTPRALPTASKKRFYNFISNNEVQENTGVFYYEVSIEQKATRETNYEPIIQANDPSLSSGSALFFNMGFTKRNIKLDKIPSSTSSLSATTLTIDLKRVQSNLCSNNLNISTNKLDDDTITFLGAEPGVSFEGSLAISFNNSCSYASIKKSDGSFRASSLNLNRRFSQLNRHASGDQETSKIDIDAPFHTYFSHEHGENKFSRTDTVGFGVNFIERSFFITLNGVMVRSIHELEITASNRYHDSIFGQGAELGPLFPMIGFRVTEFPHIASLGDVPESKIITNFGLKSFRFNIKDYVKRFKSNQTKLLKSVVSDEIRNLALTEAGYLGVVKFERAIRNVQDEPTILNKLIEGYFIKEGFLQALRCFNLDLDELSKNITQTEDEDMENSDETHLLDARVVSLKACQRKMLKDCILNRRFSDAMRILKTEFSYLPKIGQLEYELELLQYVQVLQNFYRAKCGATDSNDDASGDLEPALFKEAFKLGQRLAQKSGQAAAKALNELSAILLLNAGDDIKNLPHANSILKRHSNDVKMLASIINTEILEAENFSKESKLEYMVTRVGENVDRLSAENKNPFRLLNFEKDYMDV